MAFLRMGFSSDASWRNGVKKKTFGRVVIKDGSFMISLGGVQALEELGSYGSFQMFYGGAVSGL